MCRIIDVNMDLAVMLMRRLLEVEQAVIIATFLDVGADEARARRDDLEQRILDALRSHCTQMQH